jgi:hypothetical protein
MPRSRLRPLMQGLQCGKVPSTSTQALPQCEYQSMDLAAELQRIYDSEINVRIDWMWDGGINVQLGDAMGGFEALETVNTVAEIVPWLQEAIAHFYPKSSYARTLDAAVHERAARRLFQPPRVGFQVRCPHCGAPHAAPPVFDELLGFVCNHCGSSVKVEPPKVQ